MSDDVTRSLLTRSKMGEMDRPQAASPTLLPTSSLPPPYLLPVPMWPPPTVSMATSANQMTNLHQPSIYLTRPVTLASTATIKFQQGACPRPSHPPPRGTTPTRTVTIATEKERERKRERALRCHDNRAGAELHPFKPSTWL